MGSGALIFTASAGAKSASQRVDVSVRPAAAYRMQVSFSRLAPNTGKTVSDLRHIYDAYATRDASVSTVPLALSQGLTAWLVNTDNYCTEQIVSASMPRLVASKWSAVPAFARALQPGLSGPQKGDALAEQIDAIRSRQNEQGGFGLWTATPDSEPFISAYAMHFLIEARDRGVAVPKETIDDGNRYLQLLADDDSAQTLYRLRERAYAVYLLTRQGNVTTNDIASVQRRLEEAYPNTWKYDLAAGWLAASYVMLKQDDQANQLISPLQAHLERRDDDGHYLYAYYDDPLIDDSTVLYLLAKHFPGRAKALSARAMENVARPLEINRFNTLSAAMAMLAFDAYANTNAAAVDKLSIAEMHANGAQFAITKLQNNMLQAGSFSGLATGLRINDASALPAWAMVAQAGYDRDVPTSEIKNGLEILREYTDTKGNALDKITLGEEIDVHLKIRATGDKGEGDIAVVDLLPGGFDPVITQSLRQPTSTWTPAYSDVREDRVVIYGSASPDVQEFVYRIKASAAGRFIVPPAYGESMYDRRVQARAKGGDVLTVVRP